MLLAQFPPQADTVEFRQLEEQCEVKGVTDLAEPVAAEQHRSPQLRSALNSWPALWAALQSPATSYRDRLAMAYQGAAVVEPSGFVQIWKALAKPPTAHTKQSPCFRIGSAGGFLVNADSLPPYPVAAADRERAPLEWQLERALAVLQDGVLEHYRTTGQYNRVRVAALAWEPGSYEESSRRAAVISGAPDGPQRTGDLVRISITDHYVTIGLSQSLYVPCHNKFRDQELAHMGLVLMLEHARTEGAAAAAAYQLAKQAERTVDCPSAKPSPRPHKTYTALVGLARWATRQSSKIYDR